VVLANVFATVPLPTAVGPASTIKRLRLRERLVASRSMRKLRSRTRCF
jgi:hypothetical protein